MGRAHDRAGCSLRCSESWYQPRQSTFARQLCKPVKLFHQTSWNGTELQPEKETRAAGHVHTLARCLSSRSSANEQPMTKEITEYMHELISAHCDVLIPPQKTWLLTQFRLRNGFRGQTSADEIIYVYFEILATFSSWSGQKWLLLSSSELFLQHSSSGNIEFQARK